MARNVSDPLNAEDRDGEAFDTDRRFVRITGERTDGFIEFDFAIGEPELFVELLLSRPAFEEFCANNHAELLTAQPHRTDAGGNPDDLHWRLADVVPQQTDTTTQQRS